MFPDRTSEMVSSMIIPCLIECIASDYAESRSRKLEHTDGHYN